jgi:hypothetical protein
MVDGNISDLFFNLDHSSNKITDTRGHFVGFDSVKLAEEADWFLDALQRLGVAIPEKKDLIEDFLKRI